MFYSGLLKILQASRAATSDFWATLPLFWALFFEICLPLCYLFTIRGKISFCVRSLKKYEKGVCNNALKKARKELKAKRRLKKGWELTKRNVCGFCPEIVIVLSFLCSQGFISCWSLAVLIDDGVINPVIIVCVWSAASFAALFSICYCLIKKRNKALKNIVFLRSFTL